jgi:uncharacterized protein
MAFSSSKIRILSIDGGGIRGIIPGQILITVEKLLQAHTGDPATRLADFFDLIAGTSTGGILTCLYLLPDNLDDPSKARPRFTTAEAVDLYLERGDEIFDVSLWQKVRSKGGLTDEKYSAAALEDALLDYCGEIKLSQLLKPCLITAYDLRRRQAHFFNQADARSRGPGWDFLIRDVARATSAAPTYFECVRIKSMDNIVYPLIDGGLAANNPALCAYAEARCMRRPDAPAKKTAAKKAANKRTDEKDETWTAKDMHILSLGTGNSKKPYIYKDAKDWGMVQWVQPVIDILMSASAETVDYQLKRIYEAVKAPDQYLRLDCDLPAYIDPAMDCASLENMGFLRDLGADLARKNAKAITAYLEGAV